MCVALNLALISKSDLLCCDSKGKLERPVWVQLIYKGILPTSQLNALSNKLQLTFYSCIICWALAALTLSSLSFPPTVSSAFSVLSPSRLGHLTPHSLPHLIWQTINVLTRCEKQAGFLLIWPSTQSPLHCSPCDFSVLCFSFTKVVIQLP